MIFIFAQEKKCDNKIELKLCNFYVLFLMGLLIKGWSRTIFKRDIFQFYHLLEFWDYSKKCHPRLFKIDQVFSHKGQEFFAET